MTDDAIKETVRKKYAEIATLPVIESMSGCCEPATDCNEMFSMVSDEYNKVSGYVAEADLGLGCGVPTEYARINKGDTVLDLGSGTGNDVFIARSIVGNEGYVIGIDMTEEMIERANKNKQKLGFDNVEFRFGEIENLPVKSNSINVVISNCVLNLVPDKRKAFSEIFRVLKEQGHFCVSDIVLIGELPAKIKEAASMYAGCISGAIQKDEYIEIIKAIGFKNIRIEKEKIINIPDKVLLKYINQSELKALRDSGSSVYSITVYAER
jgi:ubiquinone/menaquinone biosynthesis C-methylase UbiE